MRSRPRQSLLYYGSLNRLIDVESYGLKSIKLRPYSRDCFERMLSPPLETITYVLLILPRASAIVGMLTTSAHDTVVRSFFCAVIWLPSIDDPVPL